MEEHPDPRQPAVSFTTDRLWAHLGARMRLRREQIGISGWAAANAVGVDLQAYQDYERGRNLIPADQLAALAQILNVPVFYFFEDLQTADCVLNAAKKSEGEFGYAVATETERIASLVEYFQRLDFVRQQCLLLVAGALAEDMKAGAHLSG